MKVKELIKKLEMYNPEKNVYASIKYEGVHHIVFAPSRVDLFKGRIELVMEKEEN